MIWDVGSEFRSAARGFARDRALLFTAAIVIALGIGASTAVFSLVDRLLFRSLPYAAAEELVSVGLNHPMMDGDFLIGNDYLHLKEQPDGFSALTSWRGTSECDMTEDHPQRIRCAEVESTFLPVFGVQPILGRNFAREEDRRGAPKVAIISYGLWQARFGGSNSAVGQTIRIDGVPAQVIGVLPAGFELPTLEQADILVPQVMAITRYALGQASGPVRVFGRLQAGYTPERVREMSRAIMTEDAPAAFMNDIKVMIRPLRDFQTQNAKGPSWVLLAATLVVLLIVCANVASLLLARSAARRREVAVRIALGASRARLIRQQLIDSLVLSGLGGLFGWGVAWAVLRVFQSLAPASIPRAQQAALDGRVGLFALALIVLCGCVIAVAPSLSLPRAEILAGWRNAGDRGTRSRHLLIALQIAFSLVLLSMAGLMAHTLWTLQRTDHGLRADRVVTADITVGPERYPNSQSRRQFFDRLTERLRAMPGVRSVAISDTVPPSGFVHSRPLRLVRGAGGEIESAGSSIVASRMVSPEYFTTLGITIRQGRGFVAEDAGTHPIVISESLARRVFGTLNPVGQTVTMQQDAFHVVGIASDVSNNPMTGKPDPEYYVLRAPVTDPELGRNASLTERALHQYDGEAFVTVLADVDSSVVTRWIQSEVAAMDPSVPTIIATMQARVQTLSEREKFSAFLFAAFAAIATVLTAAGLFGLVRFLVALRTREVGVRLALGATPVEVVRLLLMQAVPWVAGGLALGIAGSKMASILWSKLLVDAPSLPLWVLGTAAALLACVTLLAAAIPAFRAGRIGPASALRLE